MNRTLLVPILLVGALLAGPTLAQDLEFGGAETTPGEAVSATAAFEPAESRHRYQTSPQCPPWATRSVHACRITGTPANRRSNASDNEPFPPASPSITN